MSVVTPGSTTRITSPPLPPLPPSGPPSGLNFSRWMDEQPGPPSPAATCRTTRSTNTLSPYQSRRAGRDDARPALCGVAGLLGRQHCDGAAAALGAELHGTGREREQRVVATAADLVARVEVGAALPDDDL